MLPFHGITHARLHAFYMTISLAYMLAARPVNSLPRLNHFAAP